MLLRRTQHALRGATPSRFRPCARCVWYNSAASFGHAAPERKVIFSGIQPTGVPHLGNYLGALRQWVKLQDEAAPDTTLLYSIVDLHAITVKQDAKQLAQWRKEMLASLQAVGLRSDRSILFYQSSVPQHAELMWILSCNASMGYLGRMTQWKSKLALPDSASPLDSSPSNKSALKLGLFSYPVLQAADILLYNTTHVPVGEDQAQHLEFARELAISFNHTHAPQAEAPLLVPPTTILSPAKRVMSLSNPAKKMSKSDADVKSRILISDSKEEIRRKLRSALTDSIEGITYDRENRPGVSNLVNLIYYMDESVGASPEMLAQDMQGLSMKALKEKAVETVEDRIRDVRERYEYYMRLPPSELGELAEGGGQRAQDIAKGTMKRVRTAMGMA
ncbi:tryptophanyl-tRNA synthetase-like protein [Massariosphaeria phaeospora]|uniref:Tryptophan--tRNA ligase, mitochondrial n=1 Tax=Massariosphaeria phaeospora TaxID=100035 RepID=A0A7C8I3J9_9PLEO|nr:tryptophanyl-tRNA synthetase-like protein [Massariosphaeria phaeospora]